MQLNACLCEQMKKLAANSSQIVSLEPWLGLHKVLEVRSKIVLLSVCHQGKINESNTFSFSTLCSANSQWD